MGISDQTVSAANTAHTPSATPFPHDPIAVQPGEIVGRYQVRRLIGEGGMGQVFLARDVVLGRSVALKIVGPTTGAGLSTARFLHEARAIARASSRNRSVDSPAPGRGPTILSATERPSTTSRAR